MVRRRARFDGTCRRRGYAERAHWAEKCQLVRARKYARTLRAAVFHKRCGRRRIPAGIQPIGQYRSSRKARPGDPGTARLYGHRRKQLKRQRRHPWDDDAARIWPQRWKALSPYSRRKQFAAQHPCVRTAAKHPRPGFTLP